MSSFPEYLCDALCGYGVDTVFGLVGIPIVELADTLILKGKIRFVGFRNEQAASYAASAYGYLTGKPAVLLTVGGPGVIHALAGVYNSISNKWPLLVVAGSSEDVHRGGFQELDQVSLLSPYVKFSARLNPSNVDEMLYNALRQASLGTPGVSYLDLRGDVFHQKCLRNEPERPRPLHAVKYQPVDLDLEFVAGVLRSSKNVLCVIGKGATNNANEVRQFVKQFQIPFLPTPMAKGVVPDSSALNVSSARSLALRSADVVLVLGARLNWILHFGEPPRWKDSAVFIQVDTTAEDLGHNNAHGTTYSLCGDVGLTLQRLTPLLKEVKYTGVSQELGDKIQANQDVLRAKEDVKKTTGTTALTYNQVYAMVRRCIVDQNTIIVSEGANTMDVARVSFPTDYPKQRLDAGTNATMGVGVGYAIAAKLAHPDKLVLCIQGDSAFGFSGMELETAARCHLGMVFMVMNNGGIYHGDSGANDPSTGTVSNRELASTSLTRKCRYDLVAEGLGCRGFLVENITELNDAFQKALKIAATGQPALLNVIIEPGRQGKLEFGWQNKPKL
ncbi:LAME_0E12046g1_1 [Lachancea meyersii CBS 8951]|uniref:2-hydroxyacyl-CoA lyase n=1 Tax=Lachancea meyersii CBS 8951 TaxID=1266667 RepID=A0A1G4JL49_9SACH|nr:LAME_0E12046g1_1 [Lachancea meyersii CBS 8951]